MRPCLLPALTALLLGTATPSLAQDDLGMGRMWSFEDPPLRRLRERYGLDAGPAWFDGLRKATVRLNIGRTDASGCWVSDRGLLLTNQHLLRRLFDQLEQGETLRRQGFVAGTRAAEIRLPRTSVEQLIRTEEVTASCDAEVPPVDTGLQGSALQDALAAAAERRRDNERAILDAARASHPDLRFRLVRLHGGATVHLHGYKVYEDVRLVCIPDASVAVFGGEIDNFAWPRYALDFAFLRVWDEDEPLDTTDRRLVWSRSPVEAGDPVFVAGFPEGTQRLAPLSQLEFLRDVRYPLLIELITDRLAVRRAVAQEDSDQAADLRDTLAAWSNAEKTYRGFLAGLLDPARMQRKRLDEALLRRTVQEAAALELRYGDLWAQIERTAEARGQLELRSQFHDYARHPLLRTALRLALIADAEDEAEAEQLRDRARAEHARLSEQGIDPIARGDFIAHVNRATRWLPSNDPWRVGVVRGRSAEAIADLLDEDPLLEPGVFERALEGDLNSHRSEALALARGIAPLFRSHRREDRHLRRVERHLESRLGELLYTIGKDRLGSDATGTLRFSDGVVAGYRSTDTLLAHRTTFHGLLERSLVFDGEAPFDLDPAWLEIGPPQLLGTTLDLASSNDIAAGNSGSPLVDRELRLVGVVFDGNRPTLANRHVFLENTSRTISVSTAAIELALREVLDAEALLAEILE